MVERNTLRAMAALTIFCTAPASANSWYPSNCTTYDYCAAVENVIWFDPTGDGTPQLVVESRAGRAVVQRNFAVMESKDARMHVCVRYDPFGGLEVTCLLVPTALTP